MSPTVWVEYCGRCGDDVPDGGSHIVINTPAAGRHILYCPECCPCVRTPATVVPYNGHLG